MGLRVLQEILASEVQNGVVLHWEDGEHPTSVEEVFVVHKLAEPS
jgi:hypothetical protein